MKLVSTQDPNYSVSWKDAVLRGLALDGGLYIPEALPTPHTPLWGLSASSSFTDVARTLSTAFLCPDIPSTDIEEICREAFTFDAPLHQLDDNTFVLELFHGPTAAFKDFGARFMAGVFRHFWGIRAQPLTVLVATSGDTGGAVANAFFDIAPDAPIRVAILYPRDKVSPIQRKQMTTLGHNVSAYEVRGSFDDCQRLVKTALGDPALNEVVSLTSANSINIARLLPQMFYYAYAISRLSRADTLTISVPSGNLGNLTGGVLAHICGFPVGRFLAACNANRTFPDFLVNGTYTPSSSRETISNAMDVGNPSNFVRLRALEATLGAPIQKLVRGYSISDDETRRTMRDFYTRYAYILDPHTAVGAQALSRYRSEEASTNTGVIVATAHPAKFGSVVSETLGRLPDMPENLAHTLNKQEFSIPLENGYQALRAHLLRSIHPA